MLLFQRPLGAPLSGTPSAFTLFPSFSATPRLRSGHASAFSALKALPFAVCRST
jgi:hypothetical protein